ncbi:MAG: sugar transferase [Pseudonocardiales bacterium]
MDALDSASVRGEGLSALQATDAPSALPVARPVAPKSQRWEGEYLRLLVAVDVAVAVLAGGTAYFLRFAVQGWYIPRYLALSLLLPMAWLLTLSLSQAYESRYLYVGPDEYRRVLVAALTFAAGIAFFSYTVHLSLARGYVAIAVSILLLGDLMGRHALRKWLHRHRARDGRFMKRVVLVGYERAVANLCRQLSRERYHGVQVVGACLPPHRPRRKRLDDVDVDVLGTFNDVVSAVEVSGADAVAVLACPELDAEVLRGLAWQLEKTRTDLFVAPALIDVAGPRTTIRPVDGLPLMHVEHPELAGTRRVVKTSFDVVLAALALVVLAPLMFAVGLATRLTSPGPALFRQTRVGKEGQTFSLYKFRTMYDGSEARLDEVMSLNNHEGVLFKARRDPRVTALGRWLRRYSIDELPQLVNVLRGDMSLVGPRPPLPSEVELYAGHVRRRLVVKPGLTGLWQVSGRADLPWEEAVRLDLRYVENWSLALDVVILARTINAVVRSSGAY